MCHKIAADNALCVLINHTHQDTENLLKDNCVMSATSQDTELLVYHTGYNKTN